MSPGCWRRLAASITIVVLVSFASMPTVGAGSPASWGGRVFDGDRATPREGVVVSLRSDAGQASVRSKPTRADGAFLIESTPPGTYTLAVETEEGVFLSSEPLSLQPGSNTPLALSLRPAGYSASQEHGFGDDDDDRPKVVGWVVGGVVIVFALFVLDKLFEDSKEPTSTQVLTTP